MDAILGLLSALETQFDDELTNKTENKHIAKDTEYKNTADSKMIPSVPTLLVTETSAGDGNNSITDQETKNDPSYTNRSHRMSDSGGSSGSSVPPVCLNDALILLLSVYFINDLLLLCLDANAIH